MPNFSYRAYDRAGSQVAGTINAAGAKEAVQELKNTGLYPTEVNASGGVSGARKGRVRADALAVFTRQLATLLASGTSLTEALSVLSENTENQKLSSVVLSLRESIAGGSSFAKALEVHFDVFSPMYRGLVVAAEASGSLESVLPRLADYFEKRAKIASEVRAALTYPALMTFVGISVLGFLFVFVIPKITRIFEETGAALPFITLILLWTADLIGSYWHITIATLSALGWLAMRKARTARGIEFLDNLILKLPWFGPMVLSFYVASFSRTLGSLLKGGVHLLKALEITADAVGNQNFRKMIGAAVKDCTGGAALSASLKATGLLPPVVVHMIGVGERSGSLDDMLLKTADAYDAEFENGVKKSLSLLEPILILVMGLVVGFIVLAMLLPIFELNQVIR